MGYRNLISTTGSDEEEQRHECLVPRNGLHAKPEGALAAAALNDKVPAPRRRPEGARAVVEDHQGCQEHSFVVEAGRRAAAATGAASLARCGGVALGDRSALRRFIRGVVPSGAEGVGRRWFVSSGAGPRSCPMLRPLICCGPFRPVNATVVNTINSTVKTTSPRTTCTATAATIGRPKR